MNLTLHTSHLELTPALRVAAEHAASEALQAMNASPETPVTVTLRGPADAGAHHYRAKGAIEVPEGLLQAEGRGSEAGEAVAAMQHALVRQAQGWQLRHAARLASPDAAPVRDRLASEEARRHGEPGRDPNRETDHRPHGYR